VHVNCISNLYISIDVEWMDVYLYIISLVISECYLTMLTFAGMADVEVSEQHSSTVVG
jgi:hypothetical protein